MKCCLTPARELNKKLVLQSRMATKSYDSYGQAAKPWGDDDRGVWAKVEPLGGRELELARQVHPSARWRATLRYRSDLTTKKRFLLGERELYIIHVEDLDRSQDVIALLGEEPS